MRLYSHFKSSASHRVRIAVELKGAPIEIVPVHLKLHDGPQSSDTFRDVNPQQLVPVLEDGDLRLTQSLAIFDHLDRRFPDGPPLFPRDDAGRARVLALCLYVACEIQPLQNLRVERYLDRALGLDVAARTAFKSHFQTVGFDVVEQMVSDGAAGTFAHGDAPGAADCMIVAQAGAVRRTGGDLVRWPTLAQIVAACEAHPAFVAAAPENQVDAPPPGA